MHEHQLVVFGQFLQERMLRTIDALPSEPHRRQHADLLGLGRVADLATAQRRGLEQPIDPLLDEIVFLVVDVGRAKVGVMGE